MSLGDVEFPIYQSRLLLRFSCRLEINFLSMSTDFRCLRTCKLSEVIICF